MRALWTAFIEDPIQRERITATPGTLHVRFFAAAALFNDRLEVVRFTGRDNLNGLRVFLDNLHFFLLFHKLIERIGKPGRYARDLWLGQIPGRLVLLLQEGTQLSTVHHLLLLLLLLLLLFPNLLLILQTPDTG